MALKFAKWPRNPLKAAACAAMESNNLRELRRLPENLPLAAALHRAAAAHEAAPPTRAPTEGFWRGARMT
eukprot:CAMPEP_0183527406 /NCGR_PEP_ID=MMETSP0371-20130417/21997_1 /TAXON_ID=268820 /ORGANISM="Peridinium aciculiferum, Strain PAER-2" /LENGTH=69 /DNA_ID=CAMNT_0025726873 /DNA_START=121 /DNA_END=327 /DNA_ORIENTATION=+